jgi:hypothetical protein
VLTLGLLGRSAKERTAHTGPTRRRLRLSLNSAILTVALLSAALLATGAIELYGAYGQTSATLVNLQREKAAGGAVQIQAFIDDIEHQIRWVTQTTTSVTTPGQRRDDYYRLLHQVEAVTDVSERQ